jgi:release factor glutamine methyltransferase
MQLLEILNLTTAYLEKHHITPPRLNAELLIGHLLGLERMQLYLQFDRPISPAERDALRELLRRRAAGEPLQHITGHCHFHGLCLACDKRALIPRPETELLVELALQKMTSVHGHLLDVGTGTGAIALALLHKKTGWQATATDISPDALALAAQNAAALGLADRIRFHEGDLCWPAPPAPFALIAANLPYIPSAQIALLPPEVRHDPLLALDGGADGLQLIRRLLAPALAALQPGGFLFLEIHPPQAPILRGELLAAGYGNITVHRDLAGRERIISAMRPA